MGFLNGLGRFLQGKPVFQGDEAQKSEVSPGQPSNTEPKQSPLVDERGYKNIPHITLNNVKARRSGDKMIVTAWATNHSDRNVRVDHLTVLGRKQVFQRQLGPGKSYDLMVYEGNVTNNEHDSDADLVFRIMENGDSFKNEYKVEYNRESDGKFVIEEFHDDEVRDI